MQISHPLTPHILQARRATQVGDDNLRGNNLRVALVEFSLDRVQEAKGDRALKFFTAHCQIDQAPFNNHVERVVIIAAHVKGTPQRSTQQCAEHCPRLPVRQVRGAHTSFSKRHVRKCVTTPLLYRQDGKTSIRKPGWGSTCTCTSVWHLQKHLFFREWSL